MHEPSRAAALSDLGSRAALSEPSPKEFLFGNLAPTEEDSSAADALKSAGNSAFQKEEYVAAIDLFAAAIGKDGTKYVFFSNRSAALLSVGRKFEALADARRTLVLALSWSKGFGRLGAALHALGFFADAVAAYLKGILLDPSNKQLLAGLIAAQDGLVAAQEGFLAAQEGFLAAQNRHVALIAAQQLAHLRVVLKIIALRCLVTESATSHTVGDGSGSDDVDPSWQFEEALLSEIHADFDRLASHSEAASAPCTESDASARVVLTRAIYHAVRNCTSAAVDALECPPKGHDCSQMDDGVARRRSVRRIGEPLRSVHSHVGEVLRRVVAALAELEGSFGIPRGFAASFALLYERHYNDCLDLEIPDFGLVANDASGIPRLTCETQLAIVECKARHLLGHSVPCIGERQAAGYAAQRLLLLLHDVTDTASLDACPLTADAIFTDSMTLTFVRVTVASSGVAIRAHRMPLLIQSPLPKSTARADGGSGAVLFGLALVLSLRLHAVQNKLSQVTLASGFGRTLDGVAASLCGRGRYGSVYALEDFVVKLPSSRRASPASWAAHCTTEYAALSILGSNRGASICVHVPVLVCCSSTEGGVGRPTLTDSVSAAIKKAYSPFATLLAAAAVLDPALAIPIVGFSVANVASQCLALVMQPRCSTTLHGACLELRRAGFEAPESVSVFALAVLTPIVCAVGYARDLGICHVDISAKNIAFAEWNALSFLRLAADVTSFARGLPGRGCVFPSLEVAPSCIRPRVIVLDWGCAEALRRGTAFADSSHARDVRQCVELVVCVAGLFVGPRHQSVSGTEVRDTSAVARAWVRDVDRRAAVVLSRWAVGAPRPSDLISRSILSEVEFVLFGCRADPRLYAAACAITGCSHVPPWEPVAAPGRLTSAYVRAREADPPPSPRVARSGSPYHAAGIYAASHSPLILRAGLSRSLVAALTESSSVRRHDVFSGGPRGRALGAGREAQAAGTTRREPNHPSATDIRKGGTAR